MLIMAERDGYFGLRAKPALGDYGSATDLEATCAKRRLDETPHAVRHELMTGL